MRIAQVSPLYESVPPKLYGGTERVVSYLTEELVKQGHDVTLFASGDSTTNAKLVACSRESLRFDERAVDHLAPHILMIERVYKMAANFDVIHWHIDYLHFPVTRRYHVPHLTTMHGRLDTAELGSLFREYSEMPVVSVSHSQRTPLAFANWQGTVYHGLPKNQLRFEKAPGKYLAFLGRISPAKRVDRAIEIAKRTGIPLKIAAKISDARRDYYEHEIEPLLDHPLVEFIGEIGEREKEQFLGNAYALLFPIDWPEPFGLAMIEAMACGTPVIAFSGGSVPEVIDDGTSGFICNSLEEAVRAVNEVSTLSRERVRRTFEERFTAERMARDYVEIYRKLTGASIPAVHTQVTGLGRIASPSCTPEPQEGERDGYQP